MPDTYFKDEDRYFRANMGKIAIPTLIMWGRDDELIPVATAEIFKTAVPGAQAIIYDGAGHILMEDAAEPSARDLRAFLRGSPPPS